MATKVRVAAGTVTYGDRRGFLYESVDQLITEDFDRIYVLFNGVGANVMRDAKARYAGHQVFFVVSEKNEGSAGGYLRLLTYILKNDDCDRLLLLDDDNLVPSGFLGRALDLCAESSDIFYFHRPDRVLPLQTFLEQEPWKILGSDCNFLGRNVFPKTPFSLVTRNGDLLAAPYGGLFQRYLVQASCSSAVALITLRTSVSSVTKKMR